MLATREDGKDMQEKEQRTLMAAVLREGWEGISGLTKGTGLGIGVTSHPAPPPPTRLL